MDFQKIRLTVLLIFSIVLSLNLVILLHETGHYVMFKLSGVSVQTFCIGTGPILKEWVWGETWFQLRAIPFFGYVMPAKNSSVFPIQKTLIDISGIAVNLLCAWIALLWYQRGTNKNWKQHLRLWALMFLNGFNYLLQCFTLGKWQVTSIPKLSTNGRVPSFFGNMFLKLSLLVGLFNLLPISPLDGSHLLWTWVEEPTARWFSFLNFVLIFLVSFGSLHADANIIENDLLHKPMN